MPRFPVPWIQRLLPLAARRLVVLDPGDRFLKVAIADSTFASVRLIHCETIDLEQEGLSTDLDVRERLRESFPELAAWPVVVVIPQHNAISQVIDLPTTKGPGLRAAVEAEAARVGAGGEDAMRLGYARLKPFAGYSNPVWLTLCKAEAIDKAVDRCHHAFGDGAADSAEGALAEVMTSAQGILAAARASSSLPTTAVFVELRANYTSITLRVDGQGLFATSLSRGAEHFVELIRQERSLSHGDATKLLITEPLLAGGQAIPALQRAVAGWGADVKLVLSEWIEDHPTLGLSLSRLPVLLCGGGAEQPGLAEFLNGITPMQFELWVGEHVVPSGSSFTRFCVAYGAALQALGRGAQPVSLLPRQFRAVHLKQRTWDAVQAVIMAGILSLGLVLGVGLWQKASLLSAKQRLSTRTEKALGYAREIDLLHRQLNVQYERLRPVLNRQQQTAQTLNILAAVQAVRTNDDFWYVLLADGPSYGAGTTLPEAATNRSTPLARETLLAPAPGAGTNRREFIAELTIPQEGEAMRRTLEGVVSSLKRNPLFSRVDLLPPERKRSLLDPRVVITNRFFALSLEVAEEAPPVAPRPPALLDRSDRPTNTAGGRRDLRRAGPPGLSPGTRPISTNTNPTDGSRR